MSSLGQKPAGHCAAVNLCWAKNVLEDFEVTAKRDTPCTPSSLAHLEIVFKNHAVKELELPLFDEALHHNRLLSDPR